MPLEHHTPLLIGSGVEKSLANSIGQTFAYKARASGKVVSIDTKTNIATVKHDDGSTAVIDLSPRSIKNSGGGFYITSQLKMRSALKVGSKFIEDDVLAYDPSYFDELEDDSVSYKTGVLARVAFAALDQTFEDSVMATHSLINDTAALVTMARTVSLGVQANLQSTMKIGDKVEPSSALAVFENLTDDADLGSLLQRVGKEFDAAISELTKNVASAKYTGEIVEIRVYYNHELKELSPSLQRFIKGQIKLAQDRVEGAKGAAHDEPIRVNAPQFITRDKVNGEPVDGVLIQFLIRVRDVAAPGDKYTVSVPLKGVISRVLEKGEEPFSEDGKQIDYIISPLSIVSRMTSDAFLQLYGNAAVVGLKESVLKIFNE